MRERVDRLKRELADLVDNIVVLDVAESTHRMATRLISEMDDEDQQLGSTLIVADRQESGQGRGNRQWQSPEGGLYLSWLRSGVDAETTAKLPMLAAAAASTALASIGIDRVEIKWPNDVLVEGRKLAGILVFARHGDTAWVTVGLGVNLASAPSVEGSDGLPATSVADLIGDGDVEAWRHGLACAFIRELAGGMARPEAALQTWRERLMHRGGEPLNVRLASGEVVTGRLIEVTAEGFLRLDVDGGERVISGGDIVES